MEKEILENYLKEGYSLNRIAKETGKALTTIIYWKEKYQLKPNFKNFKSIQKSEYGETRFCQRCQKDVKTENFYQRRGRENSSPYCKPCTSDQTIERVRKLKMQMIEYKGGFCTRCGYNKYQGALEFHHLDPKAKDFNPSRLKGYSFDERIKKELDKCILVCANCHREIHYEISNNKKETL
jgi:predicted HNH restriction endonuclease